LIPTKSILIQALCDNNLLWSYDPSQLKKLSDDIIIEHTLQYGGVSELKLLFVCYSSSQIIDVWKNTLLQDRRYDKLNYYLALFYFKIPNTKSWLQAQYGERTHPRKFSLPTA
jgi:hypothetical protein